MPEFIQNYWFLFLMLFIASAVVFTWLYVINSQKLHIKWWQALIITIIHTVYGVLTVKFFALLEVGFVVENAGNMSLFGGIFFMPLMYFVCAKIMKIPVSLSFDTFVVPLAATLLFARINCLYAGCCIGRIIEGTDGMRWPTRIADILVHATFLFVLVPKIWKNKTHGTAYPIYMIVYGVGRFVIEWFRESSESSLFHIGHIWSIVSAVCGTLILLAVIFANKKGNKEK